MYFEKVIQQLALSLLIFFQFKYIIMVKYCNSCKENLRDYQILFYEKSVCKECLNKNVICEYCDRETYSTVISKHLKQIQGSTYNRSSS